MYYFYIKYKQRKMKYKQKVLQFIVISNLMREIKSQGRLMVLTCNSNFDLNVEIKIHSSILISCQAQFYFVYTFSIAFDFLIYRTITNKCIYIWIGQRM